MKTIILVLKGLLLYTTFIVAILAAMGIDSLYDQGYFTVTVIIVVSLIYACHKTLTEEDVDILTGNKWLNCSITDGEL